MFTIFLFLAYKTSHPNRQRCDYNNPPAPGKSCDFDLQELYPCSSEKNYGFNQDSLCVVIELNKRPGWSPDYYNSSELPSEMPNDLRHLIKYQDQSSETKNKKIAWLSCEGEKPADMENMGAIQYSPLRGFRSYDIESTGDTKPLVAIHFERPQSKIFDAMNNANKNVKLLF